MPKYHQFRVTLREITPKIWREFLIRDNATFEDLHIAIQDACGWMQCHLFEFRLTVAGDPIAGIPDDEFGEKIPAAGRVKLSKIFGDGGAKHCVYIYDFGDDWVHDVKLVKIVVLAEKFKRRLLDGARAFPPEDCGSIPGYFRFVKLLKTGKDPYGEDVSESLGWLGDWRPENFDLAEIGKGFDE